MSAPVTNEHQPSMTEWFAAIGNVDRSNKFREEDNRKVDRLEVLFQAFGLLYERPVILPAKVLTDSTLVWQELLAVRGDELCAIRLVPNRPELPKILWDVVRPRSVDEV